MNRTFVILGVVLILLGVIEFILTWFTTLYQNRVHRGLVPTGGGALAVLGVLIVVGGLMMGKPSKGTKGQFKCSTCGAVFGSQQALDQHSKDKHGMKTNA